MVKLIVGGPAEFVGSKIIRLASLNPVVMSVVGLSRRETIIPSGATHREKLKSFVVEDFEDYSEDIQKKFEDADACIWTIAVTQSKAKDHIWEEIAKTCCDYVLNAVQTIMAIPCKPDQQLRFVYISGHFALRKGDMPIQKFEDESITKMLSLRSVNVGRARRNSSSFGRRVSWQDQTQIAKPGFVTAPGRQPPPIPGLLSVELRDISAALLHQALNGSKRDTLSNDDLARLEQKAMAE